MNLKQAQLTINRVNLFNQRMPEDKKHKNWHWVLYNDGETLWYFLDVTRDEELIIFYDAENGMLALSPEEIKAIGINDIEEA